MQLVEDETVVRTDSVRVSADTAPADRVTRCWRGGPSVATVRSIGREQVYAAQPAD